jgi:site-specific DNA-methyltransferase (adenine-specific)
MASELKNVDGITRQIAKLKHAAAEIRSCREVAEVKKFADGAHLIKLAARRVGASIEVQNEATEASIRARHWEGTLLREMPNARTGPRGNGELRQPCGHNSPSLEELGISRNESSNAQALALIPEADLTEAIEAVKAAGGELVAQRFIDQGRLLRAREGAGSAPAPPRSAAAIPDAAGNGAVVCGHARWLPFPVDSFHCIVTSPPYPGLRRYGSGPGEIGRERTVRAYVDALIGTFREAKRVLRPDGVMWVVLGEKYHDNRLVDIPGLVARAAERDGWILAGRIVWAKAKMEDGVLKGGCMPQSYRRRVTTSHEFALMLVKQPSYYFDNEGVKAESGAKLRSVWEIGTPKGRRGHFAEMPVLLAEYCIGLTTSEGACPRCLAPWRRLTDSEKFKTRPGTNSKVNRASAFEDSPYNSHLGKIVGNRDPERKETVSWTAGWEPTCSCGLAETVPCRVLDMFGGMATTAVAAANLGRVGVAVELNPEYCVEALARIREET